MMAVQESIIGERSRAPRASRDDGPLIEASGRRVTKPGEHPESLFRWFRWGWLPLVGGCVVIALATMLGWELVTRTLVEGSESLVERFSFFLRALIASVLMALWAGFYVFYARQRILSVYTRLRREEMALAERSWRAEQSIGMGALSRILAHEIRTPLNGMALNEALLKRKLAKMPGSEELLPLVDILAGETTRLAHLVNDYLSYTQAKRIELALEPVDLRELAESVVEVQGADLRAANVRVDIAIPGNLPRVRADASKLRQALHNLLRNAIDAMPNGGVVRIEARRNDVTVMFSVSDNGPGFEDPASVLRPFYTTKPDGSGLGLAIVRDIVRAHGGEIEARNRSSSGGAEVRVHLPLRQGGR